jgi:hypothetical protein
MPMTSLIALADAVLTNRIKQAWKIVLPISICIGGAGGMQPSDISHGATLMMEKSMDSHSRGAIACADVERYYDQIPLMTVLEKLEKCGLNKETANAILRLHWKTKIQLAVMGSLAEIGARTRGCLTGSRSAVVLGKVPMEWAIARLVPKWTKANFGWQKNTVVASIYVDNIWFYSDAPSTAMAMALEFEELLLNEWQLKYKPSSRELMPARGCREEVLHRPEWPVVEMTKILGTTVDNAGALHMAVDQTLRSVQKLGWKVAAQAAKSTTSWKRKERFLESTVGGLLASRWHLWGPSSQLGIRLGRAQRRLWALAAGLRRGPQEEWLAWTRRRGRLARDLVTTEWGVKQSSAACSWYNHMMRGHIAGSTANQCLLIRDLSWLKQRRVLQGSASVWGGRTASRVPTREGGRVQKRFEECIEWAQTEPHLR